MWQVLAAHVTHDTLRALLVNHSHVDLHLRLRAEGPSAGRAEHFLHLYPMLGLEVHPQALRHHHLAALDTNALKCFMLFPIQNLPN